MNHIRSITGAKVILKLLVTFAGFCCLNQLAVAGVSPEIKVKEYHAFHEVLHPLEHEAVPAKDWGRIRAQSEELVKSGQAIVKLGVPPGTAEKHLAEFSKELARFEAALKQFEGAARKGTDQEVENGFASVHDSFEMLLGMIP